MVRKITRLLQKKFCECDQESVVFADVEMKNGDIITVYVQDGEGYLLLAEGGLLQFQNLENVSEWIVKKYFKKSLYK